MKSALLISLLAISAVVLCGCKPKERPAESEPGPEAVRATREPRPVLEPQPPANPEAEKAAVDCANAWLALIDSEDYAGSWDQAATFFKGVVSQENWQKSLETFRKPMGKVVSRKVRSTRYTTIAPGAPDGQYVIVQYESSFENKKSAVETITPMLEADGEWRVSGYYIR
ncbi:MAG: DUF4019 domain-containing protein [Phycisphaerales bacterium]|nr:MAG: DUF4019 domain-containing protein [Phycisphaerales bacterium]